MNPLRKTSRRGFLTLSAAAIGGVGFNLSLSPLVKAMGTGQELLEITSWVVIGPDNRVVVRIPQSELGQGITTALTQVIAEELNLDLALTDWEFYDPLTNYSRHNVYGYTPTLASIGAKMLFEPMRTAGAQIRMMLLEVAAERWKTPADALEVADHHVLNPSTSARIGFGELAPKASTMPIPDASKVLRTKAADWRYIGKRVPRSDALDKSTGKAMYGIDVTLPGMKYAAIRQCPVFGGSLKSFNETAIKDFPGVQKVVTVKAGPSGYTVPDFFYEVIDWEMDDAVAVVADSWWHAQQALDALPVVWDEGENATVSTADIDQQLLKGIGESGEIIRQEGDVEKGFRESDKVIEATYQYPFLEHAPLEPMNCTAVVDKGRVEAWAPTQYGDEAFRIAAYAAGVAPHNVKFHLTLAGGGFGRRLHNDYVSQAVQIAKQMNGTPVKLIWSREESTRRSYYPPVMAAKFKGGLDKAGQIKSWESHVCQGTSVYQPYGMSRMVHSVPHTKIAYSTITTPPPFAWMRGVGHTQSLWMYHGFICELAAAAGTDSLTFQRELLDVARITEGPAYNSFHGLESSYEDTVARVKRFKHRLDEVARLSDADFTPKQGTGRGFAVYDMSYAPGLASSTIAVAMEVSIDSQGKLRVERGIASVDCGLAINPELVENQVAGGMIFGISNALYGEITLKNGRVEQSNFHDYPILKLKDAPKIEVHLAKSDSQTPNGVGEGGVPVVIAALVDAIFQAGGPRVRKLPILSENGALSL